MLSEDTLREALTFDDVLLVPAESDVMPRDVQLHTRLTNSIPLQMPIVSSAMDTVTEAATAICMAREGGIGIIHKNLSVAEKATEVQKVKKAESGVVVDPVHGAWPVALALQTMNVSVAYDHLVHRDAPEETEMLLAATMRIWRAALGLQD